MRATRWIPTLVACWLPGVAVAHDLWLLPVPARIDASGTVTVGMLLGEAGDVETAYFQPDRIERLSVGAQPIPIASPVPGVAVKLEGAATHSIAYVSLPANSELPPAKFDAYLAEEHLATAIAARRGTTDDSPVRERYSRSIKALVGVGDAPLQDCPLGLPLELSLLPARPGKFSVRATFDGKPVPGVWIDLADARSTVSQEMAADRDGIVTFTAQPGVSVVRATHMLPSTEPGVAWRSWWAATTFSLAGDTAIDACP